VSADPDQALRDEIAAIVRELEGLNLAKAERDRRLTLNATLEARRRELDARLKRRGLEAQLASLQAELARLGPGPADKARRRELLQQTARLKSELETT
jgi:hypothetical protein